MVAETSRRRSRFQGEAWIRMADEQEWLFTVPQTPGVDADYDALVQGLLEAEDQSEARKFELAIAILLLSRNYQPSPCEYEEILCFGSADAARSAQEAISTLICSNLDQARRDTAPDRSASAAFSPPSRSLPHFVSSCAAHFRSRKAPWLH
jgi:hypothetical protein